MSAGSAHLPLLVAVLAAAFSRPWFGATLRRRWLTTAAALAFFFAATPYYYFVSLAQALRGNIIPLDETMEIVYREIAQAIRASQPEGPIVLLASPNASVSVGYYGRISTLGTLYWENRDGLVGAAEIFAAPGEAAAAQLVRRRGVTHIALVSRENYIEEYARFLYPGLTPAGIKRTFGYQLLGEGRIPVWLEPILYKPPTDLQGPLKSLRVLLFKVNFAQNPTTLYYNLGMLLTLQGQLDDAIDRFGIAAQLDPKAAEPWLRRTEIFSLKKDWRSAADSLRKGVALAPEGDRYRLITQTAIAAEQGGDIETAISLYRDAIALPMTNNIAANNLAWRLATTTRGDLRNPAEALRLAEAAFNAEPNHPGSCDTLAAALAANGRFQEALAAIQQAINLANRTGDKASLPDFLRHQNAYQSGLPWRE